MELRDGDPCLTKRALVHTSLPAVDPVGDAVIVKNVTARCDSHGAFEIAKAHDALPADGERIAATRRWRLSFGKRR